MFFWGNWTRYADVVVHRLLAASLGIEALPEKAQDRDALKELTDNLNTRHRNAQLASRASVELHTLIFFHGRSVVADARVTKVPCPPPPPAMLIACPVVSSPFTELIAAHCVTKVP